MTKRAMLFVGCRGQNATVPGQPLMRKVHAPFLSSDCTDEAEDRFCALDYPSKSTSSYCGEDFLHKFSKRLKRTRGCYLSDVESSDCSKSLVVVRHNALITILDSPRALADHYDAPGEVIGMGAVGKIQLASHKVTRATHVIKTMRKSRARKASIVQELQALKRMQHPLIAQLLDAFEDEHFVQLSLELCKGSNLGDLVVNNGALEQLRVAHLAAQILTAVAYVHSQNFAHRDITPENLVLVDEGPVEGNTVKLVDFGIAKECSDGDILTTQVGTPIFMAPQVYGNQYDRKCDLWSVGVVLYVLLSATVPYVGGSCNPALDVDVRRGHWKFRGEVWETVSADCKDLISSLLEHDAEVRPCANVALTHSWLLQDIQAGVDYVG